MTYPTDVDFAPYLRLKQAGIELNSAAEVLRDLKFYKSLKT